MFVLHSARLNARLQLLFLLIIVLVYAVMAATVVAILVPLNELRPRQWDIRTTLVSFALLTAYTVPPTLVLGNLAFPPAVRTFTRTSKKLKRRIVGGRERRDENADRADAVRWTICAGVLFGSLPWAVLLSGFAGRSSVWADIAMAGTLPAAIGCATLVTLVIVVPFVAFAVRNFARIFPDSALAFDLFWALRAAESQKRWEKIWVRRRILSYLENAAVTIERGLYTKLRVGSKGDLYWRSQTRRMAAGIRELKAWVLTPIAGTRESLCLEISTQLLHVLRGDLGLIRVADPSAAQRQSLLARVGDIIRSVTIATVPIAAVAGLSRLFPGMLAPYALPLSIGWAGLVLILRLDPGMRDRLALYKEMFGQIGPGGGKKD